MSVMKQHLVRILQLDRRPFLLTDGRLDELEKVIANHIEFVREYDEITEKHVYNVKTSQGLLCHKSKNRVDALCRLVLQTPILYEPIRLRYNELVKEHYKPKRDKTKERIEARYQRRLDLIKRLNELGK